MNSKPNNPQPKGSLNNFNFNFDLGSNFSSTNRPQPLNQQKQPPPQHQSSPYSSSSSSYAQPRPSWTPNKPSWTHQPAPSQSVRSEIVNHTSMVGDIHGKSWASKSPSTTTSSTISIGIVEKNPNLFSDLLGPALGQSKGNSNVPLKNAAPLTAAKNSSYSMGNLASSLPNTGATPVKSGSYSNVANAKTGNLGGPSMKSGGLGAAKTDPFGSFVDFSSKKEPVKLNANATKSSNGSNSDDHSFGDFQNAGKSNASSIPSSNSNDFGDFDFGTKKQTQAQPQFKGVDPLDSLFTPSTAAPTGQVRSDGAANQMFSEMEDWDTGADFGGGDAGGTMELEGLPPPPAGVSASTAKSKGLDSYKQGQHADGIKWLSWAVVLLEKAGDNANMKEVLICRASCYKEVGEYKKAIADCTKVLEEDEANVAVLVQRALLYESTEKYKLGAEDLRSVMKIDPGNRLARSTIHRLLQLAD